MREYPDPKALYGAFVVVTVGVHEVTLPDYAFRLVDRPVDKNGQSMR